MNNTCEYVNKSLYLKSIITSQKTLLSDFPRFQNIKKESERNICLEYELDNSNQT